MEYQISNPHYKKSKHLKTPLQLFIEKWLFETLNSLILFTKYALKFSNKTKSWKKYNSKNKTRTDVERQNRSTADKSAVFSLYQDYYEIYFHIMSFGDISASARGGQRGFGDINNGDKDTITVIRNALAQFQVSRTRQDWFSIIRMFVITTEIMHAIERESYRDEEA